MNHHHTNPQGNDTYSDKSYKPYLIFGIAIIALMPLILTREAWFKALDFTTTGTIGDTIGGITAPFVGILGAILVYISFNEQRKANKLQWEALKEDRYRIDQQGNFEFMYKFYSDEIKDYKSPEGKDLVKCVNDLYGDEGPFWDPKNSIIALASYFNLCLFFLDELKSSNMSHKKKRIIVALFLSNHYKYSDNLTFSSIDSRGMRYINEYYPNLMNSMNLFYDQIEDLKNNYK